VPPDDAAAAALGLGQFRAVTPGGVLVFGEGDDSTTVAFGDTAYDDADAPAPVAADTVYDVASVTKPIAAVAPLMKLVADGTVELDAPAVTWLPELCVPRADAITLRQLVGHASGFPAHIPFYERLWAGERLGAESARDALLRMIGSTELAYESGTKVIYSDLGIIALGFALERATGKRLDAVVRELVTGPLGMTATRFVDLDAPVDETWRATVAPTERCDRRGLVRGEVHDENAHASGGIVAHAGVFSTAADVARFARAIIASLRGEAAGGFDPDVVNHFLSTSAAPETTWRLGWDTPSPPPVMSHAGDAWPRDGVGHLGFTGCSMWTHAPTERYAVLLTNRVHPSRHPEGIRDLRRTVMDAVWSKLSAR
jgi:CubicO group peptidase (beta-lactamase class C family)